MTKGRPPLALHGTTPDLPSLHHSYYYITATTTALLLLAESYYNYYSEATAATDAPSPIYTPVTLYVYKH